MAAQPGLPQKGVEARGNDDRRTEKSITVEQLAENQHARREGRTRCGNSGTGRRRRLRRCASRRRWTVKAGRATPMPPAIHRNSRPSGMTPGVPSHDHRQETRGNHRDKPHGGNLQAVHAGRDPRRVDRSRADWKTTPATAKRAARSKASSHGRRTISTPSRPTAIAVQRRHPTGSARKAPLRGSRAAGWPG